MIKANELSDKQKAMTEQRTKDYIENDLEHALSEIEKLLINIVESDSESKGVPITYSCLKEHAKTDTNDKRHELCKALEKYGYKCELIDNTNRNRMVVKWST